MKDTLNMYEIKTYAKFPKRDKQGLDTKVTFSNASSKDFELPSVELLDCHWRLAEILNASGMAETVERHQRDWEDIKGSADGKQLRADGKTDIAHILNTALWGRVAC
jgi:hypothetical protein